jgi:hypothetical protein
MDGLQVQWLLDPGAVDLARATEFAIEAIVSAVLSPAPSPLAEGVAADATRSAAADQPSRATV